MPIPSTNSNEYPRKFEKRHNSYATLPASGFSVSRGKPSSMAKQKLPRVLDTTLSDVQLRHIIPLPILSPVFTRSLPGASDTFLRALVRRLKGTTRHQFAEMIASLETLISILSERFLRKSLAIYRVISSLNATQTTLAVSDTGSFLPRPMLHNHGQLARIYDPHVYSMLGISPSPLFGDDIPVYTQQQYEHTSASLHTPLPDHITTNGDSVYTPASAMAINLYYLSEFLQKSGFSPFFLKDALFYSSGAFQPPISLTYPTIQDTASDHGPTVHALRLLLARVLGEPVEIDREKTRRRALCSQCLAVWGLLPHTSTHAHASAASHTAQPHTQTHGPGQEWTRQTDATHPRAVPTHVHVHAGMGMGAGAGVSGDVHADRSTSAGVYPRRRSDATVTPATLRSASAVTTTSSGRNRALTGKSIGNLSENDDRFPGLYSATENGASSDIPYPSDCQVRLISEISQIREFSLFQIPEGRSCLCSGFSASVLSRGLGTHFPSYVAQILAAREEVMRGNPYRRNKRHGTRARSRHAHAATLSVASHGMRGSSVGMSENVGMGPHSVTTDTTAPPATTGPNIKTSVGTGKGVAMGILHSDTLASMRTGTSDGKSAVYDGSTPLHANLDVVEDSAAVQWTLLSDLDAVAHQRYTATNGGETHGRRGLLATIQRIFNGTDPELEREGELAKDGYSGKDKNSPWWFSRVSSSVSVSEDSNSNPYRLALSSNSNPVYDPYNGVSTGVGKKSRALDSRDTGTHAQSHTHAHSHTHCSTDGCTYSHSKGNASSSSINGIDNARPSYDDFSDLSRHTLRHGMRGSAHELELRMRSAAFHDRHLVFVSEVDMNTGETSLALLAKCLTLLSLITHVFLAIFPPQWVSALMLSTSMIQRMTTICHCKTTDSTNTSEIGTNTYRNTGMGVPPCTGTGTNAGHSTGVCQCMSQEPFIVPPSLCRCPTHTQTPVPVPGSTSNLSSNVKSKNIDTTVAGASPPRLLDPLARLLTKASQTHPLLHKTIHTLRSALPNDLTTSCLLHSVARTCAVTVQRWPRTRVFAEYTFGTACRIATVLMVPVSLSAPSPTLCSRTETAFYARSSLWQWFLLPIEHAELTAKQVCLLTLTPPCPPPNPSPLARRLISIAIITLRVLIPKGAFAPLDLYLSKVRAWYGLRADGTVDVRGRGGSGAVKSVPATAKSPTRLPKPSRGRPGAAQITANAAPTAAAAADATVTASRTGSAGVGIGAVPDASPEATQPLSLTLYRDIPLSFLPLLPSRATLHVTHTTSRVLAALFLLFVACILLYASVMSALLLPLLAVDAVLGSIHGLVADGVVWLSDDNTHVHKSIRALYSENSLHSGNSLYDIAPQSMPITTSLYMSTTADGAPPLRGDKSSNSDLKMTSNASNQTISSASVSSTSTSPASSTSPHSLYSSLLSSWRRQTHNTRANTPMHGTDSSTATTRRTGSMAFGLSPSLIALLPPAMSSSLLFLHAHTRPLTQYVSQTISTAITTTLHSISSHLVSRVTPLLNLFSSAPAPVPMHSSHLSLSPPLRTTYSFAYAAAERGLTLSLRLVSSCVSSLLAIYREYQDTRTHTGTPVLLRVHPAHAHMPQAAHAHDNVQPHMHPHACTSTEVCAPHISSTVSITQPVDTTQRPLMPTDAHYTATSPHPSSWPLPVHLLLSLVALLCSLVLFVIWPLVVVLHYCVTATVTRIIALTPAPVAGVFVAIVAGSLRVLLFLLHCSLSLLRLILPSSSPLARIYSSIAFLLSLPPLGNVIALITSIWRLVLLCTLGGCACVGMWWGLHRRRAHMQMKKCEHLRHAHMIATGESVLTHLSRATTAQTLTQAVLALLLTSLPSAHSGGGTSTSPDVGERAQKGGEATRVSGVGAGARAASAHHTTTTTATTRAPAPLPPAPSPPAPPSPRPPQPHTAPARTAPPDSLASAYTSASAAASLLRTSTPSPATYVELTPVPPALAPISSTHTSSTPVPAVPTHPITAPALSTRITDTEHGNAVGSDIGATSARSRPTSAGLLGTRSITDIHGTDTDGYDIAVAATVAGATASAVCVPADSLSATDESHIAATAAAAVNSASLDSLGSGAGTASIAGAGSGAIGAGRDSGTGGGTDGDGGDEVVAEVSPLSLLQLFSRTHTLLASHFPQATLSLRRGYMPALCRQQYDDLYKYAINVDVPLPLRRIVGGGMGGGIGGGVHELNLPGSHTSASGDRGSAGNSGWMANSTRGNTALNTNSTLSSPSLALDIRAGVLTLARLRMLAFLVDHPHPASLSLASSLAPATTATATPMMATQPAAASTSALTSTSASMFAQAASPSMAVSSRAAVALACWATLHAPHATYRATSTASASTSTVASTAAGPLSSLRPSHHGAMGTNSNAIGSGYSHGVGNGSARKPPLAGQHARTSLSRTASHNATHPDGNGTYGGNSNAAALGAEVGIGSGGAGMLSTYPLSNSNSNSATVSVCGSNTSGNRSPAPSRYTASSETPVPRYAASTDATQPPVFSTEKKYRQDAIYRYTASTDAAYNTSSPHTQIKKKHSARTLPSGLVSANVAREWSLRSVESVASDDYIAGEHVSGVCSADDDVYTSASTGARLDAGMGMGSDAGVVAVAAAPVLPSSPSLTASSTTASRAPGHTSVSTSTPAIESEALATRVGAVGANASEATLDITNNANTTANPIAVSASVTKDATPCHLSPTTTTSSTTCPPACAPDSASRPYYASADITSSSSIVIVSSAAPTPASSPTPMHTAAPAAAPAAPMGAAPYASNSVSGSQSPSPSASAFPLHPPAALASPSVSAESLSTNTSPAASLPYIASTSTLISVPHPPVAAASAPISPTNTNIPISTSTSAADLGAEGAHSLYRQASARLARMKGLQGTMRIRTLRSDADAAYDNLNAVNSADTLRSGNVLPQNTTGSPRNVKSPLRGNEKSMFNNRFSPRNGWTLSPCSEEESPSITHVSPCSGSDGGVDNATVCIDRADGRSQSMGDIGQYHDNNFGKSDGYNKHVDNCDERDDNNNNRRINTATETETDVRPLPPPPQPPSPSFSRPSTTATGTATTADAHQHQHRQPDELPRQTQTARYTFTTPGESVENPENLQNFGVPPEIRAVSPSSPISPAHSLSRLPPVLLPAHTAYDTDIAAGAGVGTDMGANIGFGATSRNTSSAPRRPSFSGLTLANMRRNRTHDDNMTIPDESLYNYDDKFYKYDDTRVSPSPLVGGTGTSTPDSFCFEDLTLLIPSTTLLPPISSSPPPPPLCAAVSLPLSPTRPTPTLIPSASPAHASSRPASASPDICASSGGPVSPHPSLLPPRTHSRPLSPGNYRPEFFGDSEQDSFRNSQRNSGNVGDTLIPQHSSTASPSRRCVTSTYNATTPTSATASTTSVSALAAAGVTTSTVSTSLPIAMSAPSNSSAGIDTRTGADITIPTHLRSSVSTNASIEAAAGMDQAMHKGSIPGTSPRTWSRTISERIRSPRLHSHTLPRPSSSYAATSAANPNTGSAKGATGNTSAAGVSVARGDNVADGMGSENTPYTSPISSRSRSAARTLSSDLPVHSITPALRSDPPFPSGGTRLRDRSATFADVASSPLSPLSPVSPPPARLRRRARSKTPVRGVSSGTPLRTTTLHSDAGLHGVQTLYNDTPLRSVPPLTTSSWRQLSLLSSSSLLAWSLQRYLCGCNRCQMEEGDIDVPATTMSRKTAKGNNVYTTVNATTGTTHVTTDNTTNTRRSRSTSYVALLDLPDAVEQSLSPRSDLRPTTLHAPSLASLHVQMQAVEAVRVEALSDCTVTPLPLASGVNTLRKVLEKTLSAKQT